MGLVGVAFANMCGGNCPSNDCPSCPCGTTRKFESISEWCGKYHWDQSMCQCIVNHESSGNAHANNYNTNGSFDIGFWQINSVNWDSCSGGSPPCDVSTNLQCAIKVWGWGGDSFKLWSTYRGPRHDCQRNLCCPVSTPRPSPLRFSLNLGVGRGRDGG